MLTKFGIMSRSLTSASAIAIATIWSGGPAMAQTQGASGAQTANAGAPTNTNAPATTDKPASTVTEVVVTGLRASMASAETIKRTSDQIVDSITAQDIGRLPDADIAEALQRVSGVQIQRNLGDGSVVAIRGLTQVRTELNGRDVFTADGSGASSGSQSVDFEDIGPDLLSRVDVYKNPAANMIEGSLAGTIDLRTRMPFDSPKRLFSFSGSDTYYDLAKKNGQDLSGLYSDRWNTPIGEIGVLLNASYQREYHRQDIVQVDPYWYHQSGSSYTLPNGAETLTSPAPGFANQPIAVEQGGGFNIQTGDRTRSSLNGALQWRPFDGLELYAQAFLSTYRIASAGVSFFATDSSAIPVGNYTVAKGVATSGSLQSPGGSDITFGSNKKSTADVFAGGAKWRLLNRLRLDVDYSYSTSTVNEQSMDEFLSLNNDNNGGYDLNFDNRGAFPKMTSSVPGYFSNPANYNYEALYYSPMHNEANEGAIRADLTWDFDDDNLLRKIMAGVRYDRKTAIDATNGSWQSLPSTCAGVSSGCPLSLEPSYVQLNPYQSSLLRGEAGSSVFGPVMQWNLADALHPLKAMNDFDTLAGLTGSNRLTWPCITSAAPSCGANFAQVVENDTAAYLKADFGGTVPVLSLDGHDISWDGNIGLRYISTREIGFGYEQLRYNVAGGGNANVVNPYDGGRTYDALLPSVNLRLKFTPTVVARFAFSKNIYRPDFSQLSPSFTLSPSYQTGSSTTAITVNPSLPYNASTNPYQGTGTVNGNPNLKPERVTSFDTSLEWYFAKDGYAYVTLFDKEIRDLIDSENYTLVENVPTVGNVQFAVTGLYNKSVGTANGFEVGGQKFFSSLPGILSGLGAAANLTFVNSSAGTVANATVNATTAYKVPLIDLSKYSYNLMALYDKYGWNIRIAYNWRSKYLDSTNENGAQNVPIYFAAYGALDASVSYDINKHVSLVVDGQNLNNHVERSYQGQPDLLRNYQMNDRRVSVRFRITY